MLLLADVFEKFRDKSVSSFKIDPCHCYTAPGMSWMSMLKYTNVEIEIHNADDLKKLYEAIKEKGEAKIKISIKNESKNYLFELNEKRKFDYQTLKNLNKEQYIKKISI